MRYKHHHDGGPKGGHGCCKQHGHAPEHDHNHDHHHDHHHDHDHDHDHDHGHHHGRRAPKAGILLAAFGAAIPEARTGYELFDDEVRERFPGIPVRWAYTAHKVRRKLAERGFDHDSVAVALSTLHDDGVTHLAVQSLHTVPGVEYHWTRDQALAYLHPRKGFTALEIGGPLLLEHEDLAAACAGLAGYIPPARKPGEAVVLVGHGTYHEGHQRYLDFEACVRQRDSHLYMAALMGKPGLQATMDRLTEAGLQTVWLVPFMSVPGFHVQVDISGENPRSWKRRLEAAGFTVQAPLTGTLEHAPYRALWMQHLERAVSALACRGEESSANDLQEEHTHAHH